MDYPLAPLAEFIDGPQGRTNCGVMIDCPNCGMSGAAWFKNPIDGGPPVHPVQWDRTGETLETLTLNPSFQMIGHYHSWIRNGMLCVDSEFSCVKRAIEPA
jgi:hypothetical protein